MPTLNVPNLLTLFRIFLIPVFVFFFYCSFPGHLYYAAGTFCLAGFTDWLDGFLARVLEQSSRFGAFLDPVADKLMVVTALVLVVSHYQYWWVSLGAIAIIVREISVSALREWMAEIGKRATVKVSMIGKIKTTAQMLALLVLISQPPAITPITIFGFILLAIAVALTLWSMLLYLLAAMRSMQQG